MHKVYISCLRWLQDTRVFLRLRAQETRINLVYKLSSKPMRFMRITSFIFLSALLFADDDAGWEGKGRGKGSGKGRGRRGGQPPSWGMTSRGTSCILG